MSNDPEILDVPARRTLVVAGTVPMAEIQTFYDEAFGRLAGVIEARDLDVEGAPFGLYRSMPTDTVDLEVGVVLVDGSGDPGAVEGDGVVLSQLPGGEAARLLHEGSFDTLGESWGRLMAWIGEVGRAPGGPMWEVYLVEPTPDMDPAELRTELFCPLR